MRHNYKIVHFLDKRLNSTPFSWSKKRKKKRRKNLLKLWSDLQQRSSQTLAKTEIAALFTSDPIIKKNLQLAKKHQAD